MKKAYLLLPLLLASCANVRPGEIALLVPTAGPAASREITTSDIKVGRFVYNPVTTDILKYPTTISRFEYTTEGENALRFQDKEGLAISVDAAMSMRVDPQKTPALYNRYRRPLESLMEGEFKDTLRGTVNRAAENYSAVELYGSKRSEFQGRILEQLRQRFEPMGIIIEQFEFTSAMEVPPQVQAALEKSQAATNQAIQAENELRRTRAEGEKKVAEAEANAQAVLLEAEAQAKANNILAASLTPELVQLRQIERWDGKTPLVSGSGSIVNLPEGVVPLPQAEPAPGQPGQQNPVPQQ